MMELCRLCDAECRAAAFFKSGAPFFRCSQCGFIFQAPPRNLNLTGSLNEFEGAYLRYFDESPEDRINFDTLLRWMSGFRPIHGSALIDIGAGSGKFARYLRAQGIDACGLEPSKALYARYLSGIPGFFNSTVEEFAPAARERFDVITAFDVLEHVERPKEFLEGLVTMLKPGGVLFVSTPDVNSLFARACGRQWHFYNKWHLSYFSEERLRKLAASVGLRAAAASRRGRLRSFGYMARYFFDFTIGKRVAVPAWVDRIVLPVNLFDTMYVCLSKAAQ